MVTQRKTVTFPVNNRQNYTKDIVNNQSYQKIIGLHDYLLQSIYVEEEACGKKKSSNGPARVYPILDWVWAQSSDNVQLNLIMTE